MFNGMVGTITPAIFTTALGKICIPPCGGDRYLILLVGACAISSQSLMALSVRYEEAGPISLMRKSADMLLAFALQVLVFGQIPTAFAAAGATLILVSVLASGIRKIVLKKKMKAALNDSKKS